MEHIISSQPKRCNELKVNFFLKTKVLICCSFMYLCVQLSIFFENLSKTV